MQNTLLSQPAPQPGLPEDRLGNEMGEKVRREPFPAVLGVADLTAFMVLIVLFISNVTGVQSGGPASFLYWIIGGLTFLIPCAYVTRWLVYRFPGQGTPYVWATRILGNYWGFLVVICMWWPGILSVVSALEASLLFIQFLEPTWLVSSTSQGIAMSFLLVGLVGIACLPLRYLKIILIAATAVYLSVFALIGLAGAYWLLTGHAAATSLAAPVSWQLTGENFGVYGFVLLAMLGLDAPYFMAEDIRGGRAGALHAVSYVWWGLILVLLAYALGSFGVMVVVPAGQAGNLQASALAVQMTFGPIAGAVATIILSSSHLMISVAYILMFSRLLFVMARDRRLPAALTRTNRHGVPVTTILVQGAITIGVTLLTFVAIPPFFGAIISPDKLSTIIYNVLLASATILWTLSTSFLFIFSLYLLYHRRNKMKHTLTGVLVLLVMCVAGLVSSGFGLWATVTSSWLPSSLVPNSHWWVLVTVVTLASLALPWIGSEVPRVHALLSEQKRLNEREMVLHAQLQESYEQQQVLISELGRLYKEQAQAAITDAVTGLPNHRAFMTQFDQELSRCQRSSASCALLFVDLDHFKRVNDTYGHRAGDAILREVASRLSAELRQEDFVGRYGGEEFAVILTGTDLLGASQVAGRLLLALSKEPCYWEAEDYTVARIEVTCSIGIAIYQLHGVSREELLESADYAMYQAKRGGRNRACIADVERVVPAEMMALPERRAVEIDEPGIRETVGLQALSAVAQVRDQLTSDHSHRLVFLALETGRKLMLSDEELRLLRLGAILHDIGKIGIPDAILRKPGPLTDEEWIVMRSHPQIGHNILVEIGGVFERLAGIVVAHHERWDGRGYPRGLSGDAIPLHARILSVVDSFDAMTSLRPYREPMSLQAARAELQRCSGSQYDPRVVDAFLQVIDTCCLLPQSSAPDRASEELPPIVEGAQAMQENEVAYGR